MTKQDVKYAALMVFLAVMAVAGVANAAMLLHHWYITPIDDTGGWIPFLAVAPLVMVVVIWMTFRKKNNPSWENPR